MLNTKSITIGKDDNQFEINIIQFSAIEALNLRKVLVETVKKQMGSISENQADIFKAVAGLIYEIPVELLFKLFKNCSAMEIGGLDNKENFNKVFANNLDGTIQLAMEVLDFNGFFTLNIISILSNKIPMLAPMEKALMESLSKVNQK